ncbi:hypothetical protein C5F49_06700 [Nitrosopumilus oxyclinae]|uniref:Uncharacterized protein n=2 Tax=Nitrosopumilus oxyclinae TaxID=1959104 RepID=A0A7D5R5A7_9ARCH|nr:hypothetical protein C5F49_06700 [Nitrosopumilus oxyclinae]
MLKEFVYPFIIVISSFYFLFYMVHKIKYFDANELKAGVFLQDVVNDFLAEKKDKIIAVHPVMEKTLLVHYQE